MKKKFLGLLLFLLFFSILPLLSAPMNMTAQEGSNELDIAVVDYNKVFHDYSLTRTRFVQLKKEKSNLEEFIKNKQEEIEEAKNVYNEQEQFYDEGRRREELLKIWMKMLNLEMTIKEKKEEIQASEKSIIQKINNLIDSAIERVRRDAGVDIVINKASVFSVAGDVKDLTDEVISEVSK